MNGALVCITPGCERARVAGRDGWVYPMCDSCTRNALSDAFGPSWHGDARAGVLRTSIVGDSDRLFSADVPLRVGAEQDARAASPGIGTG